MSLLKLARISGQVTHNCGLWPKMAVRNKSYYRLPRDTRKILYDYDDFHYRNAEERYAQKLRNEQEHLLRFDEEFYRGHNKRRINDKWVVNAGPDNHDNHDK